MERKIITSHVYPPIPTRTTDSHKSIRLGRFSSQQEAIEVRARAEEEHGWSRQDRTRRRTDAEAIQDLLDNYEEDEALNEIAESNEAATDEAFNTWEGDE